MAPEKKRSLCSNCKGEGWVCENHPSQPWNYGDPECCGGAGMPCQCNKYDPPWDYCEHGKGHEWESKRSGGSPSGTFYNERVVVCRNCGTEKS